MVPEIRKGSSHVLTDDENWETRVGNGAGGDEHFLGFGKGAKPKLCANVPWNTVRVSAVIIAVWGQVLVFRLYGMIGRRWVG